MKQMSHAFHQLYYHFVWHTKNSQPVLVGDFRERCLRFLRDECPKYGGRCIKVNAMPDHVHLLVELPPNVAPSAFIGKVKGGASYFANHIFEERNRLERFYWQDGYGVVTLRKADVPKVETYIAQQEELHRSRKLSQTLETFAVIVS